MTEPGDKRVGAGFETDAAERRKRRLAQLRVPARVAPEAEGMSGMRLYRKRHVVERGEIAKQRGNLERARQAERAAAVCRQRRDVAIGKPDPSGIRADLAGKLIDQRGLAGAIGTDDGVQFAFTHVELNIVRGDDATKPFRQPFDLKQRLHHDVSSPVRMATPQGSRFLRLQATEIL
jgi:hypothetical protein